MSSNLDRLATSPGGLWYVVARGTHDLELARFHTRHLADEWAQAHLSDDGIRKLLGVKRYSLEIMERVGRYDTVTKEPEPFMRLDYAYPASVTRFGDRFRELRERAGLTRAKLAGLVDVTPEAITSVERGLVPVTSEGFINDSARAFATTDSAAHDIGVELRRLSQESWPR